MDISPKYIMKLVEQIDKVLWKEFIGYKNVEFYIKKWQVCDFNSCNFDIAYENGNINLKETLHGIDGHIILKIAIDLGIETPQFISSIPMIKNVLKVNYSTAFDSFDKAIKQIEVNPDVSVGLANSTLESIIKHILEHDEVRVQWNEKDTLYKLTESILKQFQMFPNNSMPIEIKTIGSSLLNISKSIEDLRSDKTTMHGKLSKDYIINDPIYAYLIVNIIASIGLFLIGFYEKKYKKETFSEKALPREVTPDDIPF